MNHSEQPGKVLAIFLFSPLILCKGIKYDDKFLILFAIILFFWELLWITKYKPKEIEF